MTSEFGLKGQLYSFGSISTAMKVIIFFQYLSERLIDVLELTHQYSPSNSSTSSLDHLANSQSPCILQSASHY